MLAGALILVVSTIYTNYLAKKLGEEEKSKVQLWVRAYDDLLKTEPSANDNCDFTLHNEILQSNVNIPAILVNERNQIELAINFGEKRNGDKVFLAKELEKIKSSGAPPIEITTRHYKKKIYYERSKLLRLLAYFPIFQVFLITLFVLIGYLSFSAARRAEQNRVWVGMAKETAHQLGTPISGILGWIEHLKVMKKDDEDTISVVEELQNDVNRLQLIADRFSKIGSIPELKPLDVIKELVDNKIYMEKRSPRKVSFDFPSSEKESVIAKINPPLFNWVIENLLRNALDAVEGKGVISAKVSEDKQWVYINISDTGKGIPASKFKTIFQPGYTSKKRGWGLGLSLSRRIIEEYHSGKIYVKESKEGEGTTFTIQLPKG